MQVSQGGDLELRTLDSFEIQKPIALEKILSKFGYRKFKSLSENDDLFQFDQEAEATLAPS